MWWLLSAAGLALCAAACLVLACMLGIYIALLVFALAAGLILCAAGLPLTSVLAIYGALLGFKLALDLLDWCLESKNRKKLAALRKQRQRESARAPAAPPTQEQRDAEFAAMMRSCARVEQAARRQHKMS